MRNKIPSSQPEGEGASQASDCEHQKYNSASDYFEPAANGAQTVDEKLPANASDGGKLAAHLRRGSQPSHESSWSARRVLPTMRRKISSRVSFSPGTLPET